jgi:hypothetical protein
MVSALAYANHAINEASMAAPTANTTFNHPSSSFAASAPWNNSAEFGFR